MVCWWLLFRSDDEAPIGEDHDTNNNKKNRERDYSK
jgi:hypothetical protein